MSAIGDRTAILSLGLSCQTSRQIDGHVPLLRELTGDETLEKASLPFDWLISTPEGLQGMIEDRTFFPASHTELRDDNGRLRLRAHDILYWHVSRLLSHPRHPLFEETQSKFRYTAARFDKIAKLDRVVAVVSDTQANLPWVEEVWKVPLTNRQPEEADKVRNAFAAFLGRPVDLLMVSRYERPDFPQDKSFAYYHMVPEAEGWSRNPRLWRSVFEDYFRKD